MPGTPPSDFSSRHIGPQPDERDKMLAALGLASMDDLVQQAMPDAIRMTRPLDLPPALTEAEALDVLRNLAEQNRPHTAMIGLGYSGTVTPSVIRRNVLEDPAWYTAYTPYQPEISQGRLEALLNFQTMVSDLTGLPTAGASLLDEATAVAEAMTLARRSVKKGQTLLVDADTLPQTIAVVTTRATALGIDVRVAEGPLVEALADTDAFAVVVQTPGASGRLAGTDELRAVAEAAHERGALVIAACDLLALTLTTPPGEWGADVAVGSSQRFGVPLFYGGPHAGFMAVRKGLERTLPGRLVGVSRDADGTAAFRLALQTREQHIRREKATSNICTAQVLLAVTASMYAVYHGPDGLRGIAETVHSRATALAGDLTDGGLEVAHQAFFDTLLVRAPGRASDVVAAAREGGVHLRLVDADHVGVAIGEDVVEVDLAAVRNAFGVESTSGTSVGDLAGSERQSAYLTHPVFNTHHSETAMLRYLTALANRDFALDRGMIPLGSCTMKLNATTEMEPISYDGFANLHPFAPLEDAQGYATLISTLEDWLAEVTGYAKVSIQPNAGSQGELAGLLAIRGYHLANEDPDRRVCLIPSSAHGTNAASAVMAGMKVVVVAATADGSVDLDDLRAKIETHRDALAAIMVTYPSTHGVFEEGITELCALVHEAGGQVYVDGANLNALLGLAQPGQFGADVSHLNLHKTFCIPHGGGGPGVGPVGVGEHLVPFLPGHGFLDTDRAVSAAPYGSAGILPISYAYIAMMGADGLTAATEHALLAANYVAERLGGHYPVLYAGRNSRVAHECILDLRPITKASGVTVDDVAKRLVDYGFHAPTMSFPVPGTLMVEPTESEDLDELDRFCDAMIAIRAEIERVQAGEWPADDNPLVHAPHTQARVTADEWKHPYSRRVAAFPAVSTSDRCTRTATTSTGRRSAGSTAASATATWSAPARRRRRSPDPWKIDPSREKGASPAPIGSLGVAFQGTMPFTPRVSGVDLAALLDRVGPILGFVVCITVVAELASGIGVFATLARGAARLARGSVLGLWLLVVLVAVVATTVLSLDTTAVLLTPVVLALAAQLELDRAVFAYTAVWLANTASLLLPVSNLTNLLAVSRLPGVDAIGFAALTWPAALVGVAVPVLFLAVVFRRSLRGRYALPAAVPVGSRRLLVLATVVCLLLGPAFLLGVDVFLASAVAAVVLVVACAFARPDLLRWRLLPWPLVLGVSVLFIAVQYAHDHGLGALLTSAAGQGEGWLALVRVTGLGALGANVLDNLPSYLALEPAADSPLRLVALLVGVDAGPLITPWASLATLLWAARCRSAGVEVSWGRFGLRGLLLVPVLLVSAVTALWLAHG